MPAVSIIMPAFNAARYIAAALESVLAQTYRDYEIIVVDDGSSDSSAEIAQSFEQHFGGRLRVCRQSNSGVSAARNTALRIASGDLIALLDADDIWLARHLEKGVAALSSQPRVGLHHARTQRIDSDSNFLSIPPRPPLRFLSGSIARHLYTRRAHVQCSTVLFRRSLLDASGLFDEAMRVTEDRDLWYRIARLTKAAFLDEVTACYRVSPTSASSSAERMLRGQLAFLDKHLQSGAATPSDYRLARAYMDRERGDVLFGQQRHREALACYARAVARAPFIAANDYMLLRALAEPLLKPFRRIA